MKYKISNAEFALNKDEVIIHEFDTREISYSKTSEYNKQKAAGYQQLL